MQYSNIKDDTFQWNRLKCGSIYELEFVTPPVEADYIIAHFCILYFHFVLKVMLMEE